MIVRTLVTSIAVLLLLAAAGGARAAELPRAFVDTADAAPTGRLHAVLAGGDVQAALDAAEPGDVIALEAGARFTGPFTLPNKAGAGWITVRSSAPEASLPAPGTRITPAAAPLLPKLVGPDGGPALRTAPGAHHFRFIGLELMPAEGVYSQGLVVLGTHEAMSAEEVPHHLVFDRCSIHGDPGVGGKRGIALNAGATAIIDSHLAGWAGFGHDTQAIAGWNGPGPYKIVNNYLEGAGENVMFGGSDPRREGLVPSDIEFRRNHVAKPLAWRDLGVTVKNLFELKNARRVLIDGNVFENNWAHAQNGFAILFTVRNQDGGAPWSVVEDVTFTNDVVRNAASGINILGRDDLAPSQQTARVVIRNNLFEAIDGEGWGGNHFPASPAEADGDGTVGCDIDAVRAAASEP